MSTPKMGLTLANDAVDLVVIAMTKAVEDAGGSYRVSAGAVHYAIGTTRVDLHIGLVGSAAKFKAELVKTRDALEAALKSLEGL